MFQIIIMGLFTLSFAFLTLGACYEYGYDKREERFQNSPVQYNIGNRPSVLVKNTGKSRTIVEIQDKSLVEVRGL